MNRRKVWTDERVEMLRHLACDLYLNNHEIAERLGSDHNTISSTLGRFQILSPEDIHRRRSEQSRSTNRKNYDDKILPVILERQSSSQMGYLIGATMGDGTVVLEPVRGVVCLDVRSKTFAERYRDAMDYVTGGRSKFRSHNRPAGAPIKGKEIRGAGVYYWSGNCNRCVAREISARMNSEYVLRQSRDFQRAFLQGFFDADGCVCRREIDRPHRWSVEISVDDPSEADLISTVLKNFNIHHSRYLTTGKPPFLDLYRIVIRKHSGVLGFYSEIGFTVEHRKEWLEIMVSRIQRNRHARGIYKP